MIFCIITLLILEKRIIIGEMDALISIYFVAVAVGLASFITKISKSNDQNISKSELVFLVLNLIILSFIKIESIGVISVLFFSTFFLMIIKKENFFVFQILFF